MRHLGRCYRSCKSLYTLMSQSSAKMLLANTSKQHLFTLEDKVRMHIKGCEILFRATGRAVRLTGAGKRSSYTVGKDIKRIKQLVNWCCPVRYLHNICLRPFSASLRLHLRRLPGAAALTHQDELCRRSFQTPHTGVAGTAWEAPRAVHQRYCCCVSGTTE